MNRQSIIDKAITQQDRLDEVIRWFSTLDESLPGEWGYIVAVNVTFHCNVGSMDDWKVVRGYFGDRLIRRRDEPSTVQQAGYAEKVWCFDSRVKSRQDDRFPAWQLILCLNPRVTGSSCRLVEVGVAERKVYEVECDE